MAHLGCYVCADTAKLTLFDSIICRVGADDKLGSGLSTFMNEMLEVSNMV
jgi:DNA mismatch repair protein MutS